MCVCAFFNMEMTLALTILRTYIYALSLPYHLWESLPFFHTYRSATFGQRCIWVFGRMRRCHLFVMCVVDFSVQSNLQLLVYSFLVSLKTPIFATLSTDLVSLPI